MSAKCCVCTDEFPGIDDLEAHISADHYNCLPFECEKCKFAKFPTEFAIKRHYEEDHGLMEYFIRYRVSREIYEKKQKIRECLERCIRHCDVSSSQHQIGLVSRSLITGDYPNATSSHSHYQPSRQQQLHESEFLTTPPTGNSKGRSSNNHSELFQQQHGPLLSSSATDLRHQHQSDFGIGAGNADNDSYETIGGPNLIGNLLEQIKPDVDGGPLSHFDQLYAAEVTSASEGPRGIEKFITTQAQSNNGGRPESPIAVAIPFSTANSQKQPPQQQQLSHPVVVGSSGASTGTGTTSGISTGGRNTPATTTTTVVVVGGSNTPSSITSGNLPQQQNGTSSSASSLVGGILAPRSEPRTIRPTELQCQVCKLFVVNRSTSLMYHVNVKHLKLAMYKCRSCGEEFMWNKSAAIKHAQRHGGDDALIENHSERLFPTLNRHRREYFNLPKRGLEDSPTPPPCHPPSGQQDGDNGQADDQLLMAPTPPMKKPKLEREDSNKLPANLLEVKGETNEDDEDGEVAVDDDGQQTEANEADKNVQTPNTILAQLVDMARNNSGAKQQQQQAEEREKTVVITTTTKGSTSSSAQGTSSSAAGHSHGQSSSMQHTTEHLKAHKSIQCGGCGDMVINQEWIMLNHVNTKHLHMPLYKCISCNKPFENYLRSYAVRHAKFYHAGDESLLLDQRDMYWGELREACTRLFGPISKGSLGGGAGGSAE